MLHSKSVFAQKCALIAAGSIILAFGLYHVHAQSLVTEGGVLGLTLLLHHWLDLSPALTGLILNFICYLVGWRSLTGLKPTSPSAIHFRAFRRGSP